MKNLIMNSKKFHRGFFLIICILLFMILIICFSNISIFEYDFHLKYLAPNAEHLLGCDMQGRDVLYRVCVGGIISLSFAMIATMITLLISCIFGTLASCSTQLVDLLIMRLCEMIQTLPYLPLIIILSYLLMWTPALMKTALIAVIIGILNTPSLTRIIRNQFLQLQAQEYVMAARQMGATKWHILFKHLLPNTLSYIGVFVVEMFASTLLIEAGLSYLGMGIPMPYPSWGNLMNTGMNVYVFMKYPWVWLPAGVLCFLCVLAVHLMKEGLNDYLQVKKRKTR
ncbi:MAG: ABC transporter permease [Bacilli bacterium]|nr:ABC transporter permease [Bacilli bacterium]